MASYRFGKHPPQHDYRTLRLRSYLTNSLAAPPASCDTLPRVYQKLGINDPMKLFPMDGNDSVGDCTIAAAAHAVTVYKGLIGKHSVIAKKSVLKVYWHLTGGIDSGLNEIDVLNYWRQTSIGGEKILAYVSIDPKNHAHIQQGIQLFGGVYIGFQVQANCIQDFNARQTWTPGTLTNDGHAVLVTAYDASGVTVLSWGNTQQGNWAWWDECVDEAYAILPAEAKASDFTPGFNFTQLTADLAEVAN